MHYPFHRMLRMNFPCGILLTLVVASGLQAEKNWPQWRGPHGNGHFDAPVPMHWGNDDLKWATALPGNGQSSPVVWGEQIFLTSASEEGAKRLVFAVSTKGKVQWTQTAWEGEPEQSHHMNRWASATCATDGERVVAFFGKGGLHCYSVEGKRIWTRQLRGFANPWGTAASPVIVGDLVIQNCEGENVSYLAAFNKQTGADVWRTDREKLRGWSTPIVVQQGDQTTLVINGETGVRSYDVATGEELWFRKGDTGRGTPTVTPTSEGNLVVVNGRPGDMFAVRPDGSEVWRTARRGGRDLPSPIVIGNHLVVVSLRPGTATCYDAAKGTELGKSRLEGSFSASPIAANGHVMIPNEDGKVFVLKPTDKGIDIVAQNQLIPQEEGEIFRASVTPLHNGDLIIRSTQTLYCIAAKKR